MSKRGVGSIFCLIAAILYSARYIAAASYYSGPWGSAQFHAFLSYVGPPWGMVWIAFIVGVVYIVWGEFEDYRRK